MISTQEEKILQLQKEKNKEIKEEENKQLYTSWFEFLFSFFPHRWLNKNLDGTKRFFDGLTKVFLYAQKYITIVEKNSNINSAEEAIPNYENEYGIKTNPEIPINDRRGQIIAKKRMLDTPTKITDIISIASAFNLNVHIFNDFSDYSQKIFLEFKNGYSYNITTIEICKKMLEEIKRAHIASEYIVTCTVNSNFYFAPVFTINKLYIFNFEN